MDTHKKTWKVWTVFLYYALIVSLLLEKRLGKRGHALLFIILP